MKRAALLVVTLGASVAQAEGSRFAVVNLSSDPRHETIVTAIEKDIARLRPGAKPIEDVTMRKLLATGEGPDAAAKRLVNKSDLARAAGDCEAATDLAARAEAITLSSVSLDDERDLLKSIYVTNVICAHQGGRRAERDLAARRLRAHAAAPPTGLPVELWETFVASATPQPGTVELHLDSEPANAQISINFHREGVTPRTLKVPPGPTYVEIQKDGYRKAFRVLDIGAQPARALFKLVERTHDRLDQALTSVNLLRKAHPEQRTRTLSQLAQYARVDTLVVLTAQGDRARLDFFDAERGAMSQDSIDSPYDRDTGQVVALANRPTPAGVPTKEAPVAPGQSARATREGAPWWSWLVAGAIGGSLLLYIYLDRPERQSTLGVRAFWNGPRSGQ